MGSTDQLEIDEDLDYQRRFWIIQRGGWVGMGVIIAVAALGLFGHGFLSRATVGDPQGSWWMEYERFGRYDSMTDLRIHFRSSSPRVQPAIWLDRAYLEKVRIDRIVPQPAREELSAGGTVYRFHADEAAGSGHVTLYMTMREIGVINGLAGPSREDASLFRQVVYP